ncbi:alpha-galactosidase [Ohessyouella blattaphilus]|uniref:Alpha-galactosidase n=1 Tax=Ohessyouella blattaphilus TaxID=2949333 RepID=A0ABT1EIJ8_9FIRM|nr:alpha-galactosidase [Ohessyouella blattaphilus]MCP1110523.1 alpha-galactosidase [Ohessyouella blattaphilus]MCR8563917.1 alpha-galactosidase [Ohessyouella blattaphilus]MDL2249479.1 alpha-galactosidase [Lachnospiraceae bacterium OttesenSCG-928-J05]
MNKVVIIGAGSAMFSKKFIGDLLYFNDIEIDNISLVDINTEKLEIMEKVARKLVSQTGKSTTIEASSDRRDVLKDASYVINTINVGGPYRYKDDLEICDKYGVHPSVGDIINPSGVMRFLRAYPDILAICKDMETLCPDAYFFNYTNPMAPLCLALQKETTIKTFGFCHNVQSTTEQLAAYVGADLKDVSVWAAGINHMDWFLQFKVKGKDIYPQLFELAKDWDKMVALQKVEPDYGPNYNVAVYDMVRFEIMKNFGKFPSESPFHMSEYVPYFRKNKELIEKYKVERRWWLDFELGSDEYYETLKTYLANNEDIPMKKSFEYAPEIIHANLTGKPYRANLNVMNTGLIENLPADSCVEVPCYADAEGIHPCYVGRLPEQLAALNNTNISTHKLMAKAAWSKSFSAIADAIKMDPLASAVCTLEQLNDLSDELCRANKDFLADFK